MDDAERTLAVSKRPEKAARAGWFAGLRKEDSRIPRR
jgi:hypothetical protein